MDSGSEWLVDAAGCNAERLRDCQAVLRVCERIIADLDLHVVGESMVHQFPPPGGITALFLLTESHLACHTYPESGLATFNLYCCRPRPEWSWAEQLGSMLGARSVQIRRFSRGAPKERTEYAGGVGGK